MYIYIYISIYMHRSDVLGASMETRYTQQVAKLLTTLPTPTKAFLFFTKPFTTWTFPARRRHRRSGVFDYAALPPPPRPPVHAFHFYRALVSALPSLVDLIRIMFTHVVRFPRGRYSSYFSPERKRPEARLELGTFRTAVVHLPPGLLDDGPVGGGIERRNIAGFRE